MSSYVLSLDANTFDSAKAHLTMPLILTIFVKHNLDFMKITLNIPENVQSKAFDFSLYVASKMYEDGLLSAGQASEMAGVSKRTFIELMGKYGVSVFSSSVDDLLSDISNA